MAESLGKAILELRTDSKGYSRGITKAEREARGLEGRFKSVTKSVLNLKNLLIGGAIASGIALIGKALVDAGRTAEQQTLRIGTVLRVTQEEAERAFAAIREFAAPLPATTNEIVDAFIALEAVNLAATEQNLRNVTNAALATGQSIETITTALASTEVEPLRRMGIELDRTGQKAIIAFKDIQIETEKSTKAVREGLLELFAKAFPDGIERSQSTFDTAMATMQSLISDLLVGPGSDLTEFLAGLTTEANNWLQANKDLIQSGIKDFTDKLAQSTQALVQIYRELVQIFREIDKVTGPFFELLDRTEEWINARTEFINQKLFQGQNVIEYFSGAEEGAKSAVAGQEELNKATEILSRVVGDAKEGIDAYAGKSGGAGGGDGLRGAAGAAGKLSEEAKRLQKELEEQIRIDEAALDKVNDLADAWNEQADTFNLNSVELREYELQALQAALANEQLSKSARESLVFAFERAREAMQRINLKELEQQMIDFADSFGDNFVQAVESGSDELDAFGVFASDVAANINDAFADTLTELVFDFENFGDAIKSVLRSIANAFFQLIATFATNPLRIALEGSLGGAGGAAGGAGNLLGGLGGLGKSFGALGSLFGIGGGAVTSIGGASLPFAGLTGGIPAGVLPGAGFFGTLGAAIPAIGAIVAAAAVAIPLISKLLEKTPRLDIDFDTVKTEVEERAALIEDFLDPEFFLEAIGRVSVKRGGVGLGLGGDQKILEAIQKVIEASIESIQAILAKLPTDLFEKLNEALLSAEVDTESIVKGERLLEFDAKGKKIAEKFKAFIEGQLPAKLFASIRESFFLPAFESLGVASDAAQDMVDQFLADMQAAGSREERAQIGAEFLQLFDAYVDVFNLINDGMRDSFDQALSDIRSMASALDIEAANGIPSLNQIQQALEDLFETGQLTAETAQQFLQLRQAIIQLTVSLAQSVSSIASTIAQLNTDIVNLGGSAISISGDIRGAIDDLQTMLDNEALSLEEREAILNEMNNLTNQLAASELARQQQAQQARINAERNVVNSRIRNLQRVKEAENRKNQEILDSLNEQLRLVQDLESLVDSIQRNIQDLLFAPGGPESVFERIARAQSEVNRLFAQLEGAGPEERAEIGRRLQDMLNELNTLRREGFQAPSPESDALFRDIIGGLEKLEMMVEPARSSEQIQESIESIEKKSQEFLSSIDSQIESMQSRLSSLQTTSNRLTGQVAQEILALKESIREEFIKILEERLEQLGEVTEVGLVDVVNVEESQLVQLRQINNKLGNMASMQHGSGGFRNFGRGTLAMLHGREAVVPEGSAPMSVSLNLPPITFAPGQVINPNEFMKQLLMLLHDRRVTDEMAKALRGKR